MKRLARFWDIFYNSGNFNATVRLLWENDSNSVHGELVEPYCPATGSVRTENDELPAVFKNFYDFSEWIYTQTLSTWKISLDRQISLIHTYLIAHHDSETVEKALIEDMSKRPSKTIPFFLRQKTPEKEMVTDNTVTPKRQSKRS